MNPELSTIFSEHRLVTCHDMAKLLHVDRSVLGKQSKIPGFPPAIKIGQLLLFDPLDFAHRLPEDWKNRLD